VTARIGAPGPDSQTIAQVLVSGGDDRLTLDAKGVNAYGCRPTPEVRIAYSSSTANSISAAAFNAVQALHFLLGERMRTGEPAQDIYAGSIERLRARLRGIYDLDAGGSDDIAMAPSGTDLELLALTLALAAGPAVVNILVGEDEVGTGCVLSAAGRHFRSRTALSVPVPQGEPIAGFDPASVDLVTIEVRRSNGHSRPRADILEDIRAAVDAALARGRRPIVHVVHRSKTGIVVPGMAEVEQLAAHYGRRIDIAVDACQGRISPANLRHYMAMGAMVMVTGSKFIGGPPFSGFAFIPGALSQRLRMSRASFPAGLSDYFLRAEMPASWRAADRVLVPGANFGLLLRLEAAIFELQRLSVLPPDAILRVVDMFGRSIRAFVGRSRRFDLFIAAEGLRPESHIDHPFERDMLFTLRINADPPVMIEDAQALYRSLFKDKSARFADIADKIVAAEEIHTGQPVRCLQDADGRILGTLRLSLSAPLISDLAGLDEDALLARFAADFDRIEDKVDLLLRKKRGTAIMRKLKC
jgi:hypothetical protein